MERLKWRKGITLVALVITIIILLILAGITISLTIGQRGILNRAQEAGRNYQESAKREDEQLENLLKETNNIIEGIGGASEPLTEDALAKKVEIGDYVAYDTTSGVSDVSKLEYTSEIGTGMSHGNGHSQQKFIANSSIRWRVLDKDETTGEVALISEKALQAADGKNFSMYGAIGYLYAEQELNEICKIYGYGKGANTTKAFEYKIGDGLEEEIRTITGSGARSINVDDVNHITQYDPMTYTHVNNGITYKYGESYTRNIVYPTKTTQTGISQSAKERIYIETGYGYSGENITSTEKQLYENLFANDEVYCWLASRSIYLFPNEVQFYIRNMGKSGVWNGLIGTGTASAFNKREGLSALGIRPIVYLKPNLQTTAKDENGAWIISE